MGDIHSHDHILIRKMEVARAYLYLKSPFETACKETSERCNNWSKQAKT